jgi:nitrilase
VQANVANAERLVGEAADGGAELVVLPELFAYYGSQRRMREMAEPLGGSDHLPSRRAARDRSIWVLGGSVCEAVRGRVYNTSFLFDRGREAVARYRKIHLYDAERRANGRSESRRCSASGREVVTRDVDGPRLGMSICYDLRFPELYRGLDDVPARDGGVPSAFQAVTGAAHWETLLRARAIEEQCYVLAAAQWGRGDRRRRASDVRNAMVVDPWERVVVRAPDEGDGVWVRGSGRRRGSGRANAACRRCRTGALGNAC